MWPIEFNLDNPPWAGQSPEIYRQHPYYGDWFGQLFELWWKTDDPNVHIRLFFNLIQLILGGHKHIDAIVNDTLDMFVVNTDGRIEYPDYLRASSDGAADSGYSILDASLAEVEHDTIFTKLFDLGKHLPIECTECPHKRLCGGGFLPGRTSQDEVLSIKKSILCEDHFSFFSKVKQTLVQSNLDTFKDIDLSRLVVNGATTSSSS